MTISDLTKDMTIKDWVTVVTVLCGIVGTGYVLRSDVEGIKVHAAEVITLQKERDEAQDERLKENKKEIIEHLDKRFDDVKQDIRELRGEIRKR